MMPLLYASLSFEPSVETFLISSESSPSFSFLTPGGEGEFLSRLRVEEACVAGFWALGERLQARAFSCFLALGERPQARAFCCGGLSETRLDLRGELLRDRRRDRRPGLLLLLPLLDLLRS